MNVTSGPTASAGPVAPKLLVYGAAGLGGGLVLGILIAVLRALLDQTVRTGEAAASLVGAPLIGSIMADGASRRSPLVVGAAATCRSGPRNTAGSVRHCGSWTLRSGLTWCWSPRPRRRKGKSLTSVNLAISLAEDGLNVLLIDGDLRRPSAARLLGLEQQIGVTNVLIDQIDLSAAIQLWQQSNLHFLPAVRSRPTRASCWAGSGWPSWSMSCAVSTTRSSSIRRRVQPVADAAVLATLVDGIVFVVRYGKTPRGAVRSAAQSLTGIGGRVIGTVLNMRKDGRRQLRQYSYTSAAGKKSFSAAKSAAATGAEGLARHRSHAGPAGVRHAEHHHQHGPDHGPNHGADHGQGDGQCDGRQGAVDL